MMTAAATAALVVVVVAAAALAAAVAQDEWTPQLPASHEATSAAAMGSDETAPHGRTVSHWQGRGLLAVIVPDFTLEYSGIFDISREKSGISRENPDNSRENPDKNTDFCFFLLQTDPMRHSSLCTFLFIYRIFPSREGTRGT